MTITAQIDAIVADRHLLQHPFYREWTMGTLSRERLRDYAAQYYRHVEAFPRYVSAVHSQCHDLPSRQALLENLLEEERGPDNHPELWLRFAEGVGVSRQEVLSAAPHGETAALVSRFEELSRQSVGAGLSALYAYESQIPAVATAKIDGLKRFYGVEGERALGFFTVHERADVLHARTGAELIERHADQAEALAAARAACDALWTMLDGV